MSNTYAPTSADVALKAENLHVYYGSNLAVRDVDLNIPRREIVAFIGPSGCGKSTVLRCFNRMNDLIPSARMVGTITFHGTSIYDRSVDPVELRRRVGMVFQKPNPFPKTIYDNVAYGPRISGFKGDMDELVETSLRRAVLWDEVKDKLQESGFSLSGGQQQRLCIARSIAVQPEVLLMDEPCAALDPISTLKVEELMKELVQNYTIIIVTHNMQQAIRVSDHTAFFYLGELIEHASTRDLFSHPEKKQTEDYVTGKFG